MGNQSQINTYSRVVKESTYSLELDSSQEAVKKAEEDAAKKKGKKGRK